MTVYCCTDSQSTLEITTKVRLVFGNGTELLNRTMISANDIGKTPNTALWCQSPLNESNIGTWLLPNGTNLTTIPTAPLYTMSEPGQAGLFLDRAQSFTLFEGVFRCIIPDENNINQTLMAWIYDDYIFNLVGMYGTLYCDQYQHFCLPQMDLQLTQS